MFQEHQQKIEPENKREVCPRKNFSQRKANIILEQNNQATKRDIKILVTL